MYSWLTFPSRSGGAKVSEPYRLHAARRSEAAIDSLFRLSRKHPQIPCMGDFSATIPTTSIRQVLRPERLLAGFCMHTASTICWPENDRPQALREAINIKRMESALDHIIVSGSLLQKDSSLHTDETKADVFAPPFLLEEDKECGKQPFRTYRGMKYRADTATICLYGRNSDYCIKPCSSPACSRFQPITFNDVSVSPKMRPGIS